MASSNDIVRRLGDGRVIGDGPLSQRTSESCQNIHCMRIVPLTFDVRPLSQYQKTFIAIILRLRYLVLKHEELVDVLIEVDQAIRRHKDLM